VANTFGDDPMIHMDPTVQAMKTFAHHTANVLKRNPINTNKLRKMTATIDLNVPNAVQTTDIRVIETSLINKEEVFKMLALAEATGLAILLIGDPGVAKTRTVLDFTKARLLARATGTTQFNEDYMNKVFILETDEGTKSTEVKGMPDLEVLFQQNKYVLATPIADAEVVVVNEIDKAASTIRNSLLGVMNEKFLFNGKHKIKCHWNIFVGTANEIPKDEINSPFWDRFMLKMKVNRVTEGELSKYYAAGARNYKEKITVNVPTKAEIAQVVVPNDKMEKFLEVCYQKLSDRTLTFVPFLAQAISLIWDYTIDGALVKACEILVDGTNLPTQLKDLLITKEMKTLISKAELIATCKTSAEINEKIKDVELYMNSFAADGKISKGDVQDIEKLVKQALAEHPVNAKTQNLADLVD
jgi:hypothetical protein